MRILTFIALITFAVTAPAAELESRRLTHYVPQDYLETAIRTEGWTEVPLAVKGGVLKGLHHLALAEPPKVPSLRFGCAALRSGF